MKNEKGYVETLEMIIEALTLRAENAEEREAYWSEKYMKLFAVMKDEIFEKCKEMGCRPSDLTRVAYPKVKD